MGKCAHQRVGGEGEPPQLGRKGPYNSGKGQINSGGREVGENKKRREKIEQLKTKNTS